MFDSAAASPPVQLANWIRTHVPQKSGALNHLKLQKLVFYAYGAALASHHEDAVGKVEFEAWEHGPVSREVFDTFRGYGADPLPPLTERPKGYDQAVESALQDALDVYAWLDPWELRQQARLEPPWVRAWEQRQRSIPTDELRTYFEEKFGRDVRAPEYLGRSGSITLDGVPTRRYRSIHELAQVVRRSLG